MSREIVIRRDDAVDVLVLEERLIAARDGQIRPTDLAGQRVPTVVEVSGRRTFAPRQLYGLREQPVPLHADADHAEADPVTGRHGGRDQITGQRYHRVRSERCAGGSHAHAEKFTARTVGLFHGVSKARGWTDIMHHRPCGPIGSAFWGVARAPHRSLGPCRGRGSTDRQWEGSTQLAGAPTCGWTRTEGSGVG